MKKTYLKILGEPRNNDRERSANPTPPEIIGGCVVSLGAAITIPVMFGGGFVTGLLSCFMGALGSCVVIVAKRCCEDGIIAPIAKSERERMGRIRSGRIEPEPEVNVANLEGVEVETIEDRGSEEEEDRKGGIAISGGNHSKLQEVATKSYGKL